MPPDLPYTVPYPEYTRFVCVAVVPHLSPLRVVAGDAAGNVYCLEWIE
jgi:hypothetical protein